MRVAKSLSFLTRGYHQSLDDIVGDAVFDEDCEHQYLIINKKKICIICGKELKNNLSNKFFIDNQKNIN